MLENHCDARQWIFFASHSRHHSQHVNTSLDERFTIVRNCTIVEAVLWSQWSKSCNHQQFVSHKHVIPVKIFKTVLQDRFFIGKFQVCFWLGRVFLGISTLLLHSTGFQTCSSLYMYFHWLYPICPSSCPHPCPKKESSNKVTLV